MGRVRAASLWSAIYQRSTLWIPLSIPIEGMGAPRIIAHRGPHWVGLITVTECYRSQSAQWALFVY